LSKNSFRLAFSPGKKVFFRIFSTYIREKTFKCTRWITKLGGLIEMKKTLIGMSLLAAFVIMMLPAVAAEEATVAKSNLLTIQTMKLDALIKKYKDNPEPQIIFLTLAILLLKLLRMGMILIGGIILLVILRILGKQNNSTAVVA
jgi:hypothetical protein